MLPGPAQRDVLGEHTDHDSPRLPQVLRRFRGQRMEGSGHLVGERPGLTRNGVRAGGNQGLGDAPGPALPQPGVVPRAASPGRGHLLWAPGRERAVPEAGSRQARLGPCPSGECLAVGWN